MSIRLQTRLLMSVFGRSTDKLRELSNRESCDFVLWVGTKRLLKRKQLEEFLIKSFSI